MINNTLYDMTLTGNTPETGGLKVYVEFQDDGTFKLWSEDDGRVLDQDDEVRYFNCQDNAIKAARRLICQMIEVN